MNDVLGLANRTGYVRILQKLTASLSERRKEQYRSVAVLVRSE